ncbi:hypothetical protein HHK36_026213 [Tetracentron sinense]|uniref:Uncharacterized protein n=1 Tax=Tetracentron sinense TaxID=13715 RepID=A0A835D3W5_TETSI|nr:hypothetical protein HHK36_026213 [Tetracentron sinense]
MPEPKNIHELKGLQAFKQFVLSSSRSEFIEDVSTLTFGEENRQLNLLPRESSNTLKEPIGIVYLDNSSKSVSSSDASTGENSAAEFREHKTRVLSASNDGSEQGKENPIKLVTDGIHKGTESYSLLKPESTGEEKTREEQRNAEKEEKTRIFEQISNNSSEKILNIFYQI